MIRPAIALIAFAVAFPLAVAHHLGAPPDPITCTSYDFPSHWWTSAGLGHAFDFGTPGPTPGTIYYLGSEEHAGCSQSITIGVGANGGH